MLQVSPLRSRFRRAGFAGVEDFGAEFGTGGAEEIGFLVSRGVVSPKGDDGGGLTEVVLAYILNIRF